MSSSKYKKRDEYVKYLKSVQEDGFNFDLIPDPYNRDLAIMEVAIANLLKQNDIKFASKHSKEEIQIKIKELTELFTVKKDAARARNAKKREKRYARIVAIVKQEIEDRHERFSKAR